jgi:hypothetical protein
MVLNRIEALWYANATATAPCASRNRHTHDLSVYAHAMLVVCSIAQ